MEAFNTEFANKNSHIVVYDKLVGTGWTAEDFTYDEASGTITGWSESGQTKRKTLKALVLPDQTPGGADIVAVGDGAFKIPDEEITITKFGIESPNGMTSVVYPEKMKRIGGEAFAQNALTEVVFNETLVRDAGAAGVQTIGERAFYGNQLTKVQLPDTVTELGDGAFATNDITELKLSAGVTKIPSGAFSMNIRLSSITIPDTVTEIGDTAFAGARLTTLTIPKSVEKIGRKAFHLHHLTSLVIPGNVKEIGESAFEGTYKATTLKSLVLEEGVESIGRHAFKEGLLESVHLPNSIKSIGENPFLNNSGKDGSHVVELTTMNPAHKDLLDDTYKVVLVEAKKDINDYQNALKLSFETAVYTGQPLRPQVTIDGLKEGTDFTVEYNNNVEVGTATAVITGIGDYAGTISKTFTITAPQEKPGDSGNNKPGSSGNNQSGGQGGNSGTSTGNTNTSGQNRGDAAAPTGDNNHMVLWIVLLVTSMGVMVFMAEKERRRYR